jgi:large subunit ribosomal protein L24
MITEARKTAHVKKGDEVVVISGNHRGSTGKVLQVIPKKDQVIVEGVRMISKHARKSQDRPQGGIVQSEGPIHISNVKLAAPSKESKPTKAKAKVAKAKK